MSASCPHRKRKSLCVDCGGGSICQHSRQRSSCKDCGGGSICEHGKRRSQCKKCGGSSICVHGKQKSSCKVCTTLLSRPSVYQHLGDYAVAYGCSESEVMQQISCDVNGDFLFSDVFNMSGASNQPISYAAPLHSNRCVASTTTPLFFSHAPPRPLPSAGSTL